MTKNFKMFGDSGKEVDDIRYAYILVVENEDGVDEVSELLRKNKESSIKIIEEGIYYWDEELNKGYRRFSDWEVNMFKKVFATL